MSVKAVGQASAHRTDSGSAASGGSGQQQSTMQISVASWVPPLSGDTAEAQFLKSLVTGGLLNRDPNQQIPLDHHVAEVQEEFGGLQRRSFSTTARLKHHWNKQLRAGRRWPTHASGYFQKGECGGPREAHLPRCPPVAYP